MTVGKLAPLEGFYEPFDLFLMDDYISEPINVDDLQQAIGRVVPG